MANIHSVNQAGTLHHIGVGLKAQHYAEALEGQYSLSFFEVHAENYMMPGGNHLRFLEAIGDKYPLSIHGVGTSLGSAEGLDKNHLQRFRNVVDRFDPWLVSEHLAWSVHDGTYLNDLLPLPLNAMTLAVVSDNVNRMQDAIGRRILIENPSTYVAFQSTDIPEPEYLGRVADATNCGILLDVNNIYVSSRNNGFDAKDYINNIPGELVGEIHLAGHTVKSIDGAELRLDDHGSPVIDDVWALYDHTIRRFGERPTLVEWDTNVPDFTTLIDEADKARSAMQTALNTAGREAVHGAA